MNDTLPEERRPSNWVPVKEEPLYSKRPLKIICIGAGFSGLTLAYKIKHEHKLENILDLVIYEKNPEVGGTWYEVSVWTATRNKSNNDISSRTDIPELPATYRLMRTHSLLSPTRTGLTFTLQHPRLRPISSAQRGSGIWTRRFNSTREF